MARTIESPGVEIREVDLSLNATLPVGTNIFVQGFAPQGPTDMLMNLTSVTEFEQVYGSPSNAAERYFYHTAKQVLDSPGNLLCTRVPYGSGTGAGYDNAYTALAYPLVSAADISGSAVTALDVAVEYELGTPEIFEVTEEDYLKWQSGQITWVNDNPSSSISELSAIGNAAVVVINKIKVSNSNDHEGFYIGLRDTENIIDTNADGRLLYDSVQSVNYDSDGTWTAIPTATIMKNLTGLDITDSISEDLDTSVSYELDDSTYDGTLMLGIFRMDKSIYANTAGTSLQPTLVSAYVGSLYADAVHTPNGTETSFYLGTVVNEDSMYVEVLTNPNISSKGTWSPTKKVRMSNDTKALYALGVTKDTNTAGSKSIGNLPQKLERSLRLAENDEQVPIDLVLDGGLSTIWTNVGVAADGTTNTEPGAYDDTAYLKGVMETDVNFDGGKFLADQSTGTSSIIQNSWNTIYETFIQFAASTRKDCLFIADPLKNVFVQGRLTTLTDKTKNFSQHIYWPMKNLLTAANSNYSCTYGNWVKVYDNNLGDFTWLPFSGYEAKIMANLDSVQYPWFAPAGLNNGIVRGIVDIAINPTQKQRDLLYRISVNPVVLFPGDGYTVWGQKTLQKKPSAFDRINVRRLFLTLEKATKSIMRYFVFEPNTVFTRTRVVNVLTPIFDVPLNNEGIYEYLLVCDERNNTPKIIDANELAVDIYIKPVRTAEYILCSFYATRTDQDFTELI